jgi:hypothetical protein
MLYLSNVEKMLALLDGEMILRSVYFGVSMTICECDTSIWMVKNFRAMVMSLNFEHMESNSSSPMDYVSPLRWNSNWSASY